MEYKEIKDEIYNVMKILCISRMPTSIEVRKFGVKGLESEISKSGGYIEWANKLYLPTKKKIKKVNDIEIYLFDQINIVKEKLKIKRMPSFSEIKEVLKDDATPVLGLIRRNGGYRVWAEKFNLSLKDCETNLGVDYEEIVSNIMKEKGFDVIQTPIKHPYDLFVNNTTKVDVKVAHLYHDTGKDTYFYKFGLHKDLPQSDFYILIALNDNEEIFKILIIPSHKLKMDVVSVGIKSKYDIYKDKWDLIESHSKFIAEMK